MDDNIEYFNKNYHDGEFDYYFGYRLNKISNRLFFEGRFNEYVLCFREFLGDKKINYFDNIFDFIDNNLFFIDSCIQINDFYLASAYSFLEKELIIKYHSKSHPYYNRSLNILAHSLMGLENYYGALKYLNEALTSYPITSFDKAITLGHIASAQTFCGKYNDARKNYYQAISIFNNLPEYEINDYICLWDHLAQLYHEIGDIEESINIYKKIFKFISDNPDIVILNYPRLLNNFGLMYSDSGNVFEAIQLFQNAIDKSDKTNVKLFPSLGTYYLNIGRIYNSIKRLDKAIFYVNQALDFFHSSIPPKKLGLLNCYDLLAIICEKQGKIKEAGKNLEKSLECIKQFPKKNPEWAHAYQNVSNFYFRLKHIDEALKMNDLSLKIFGYNKGDNSAGYLAALATRGEIFLSLGKITEAIDIFKNSINNEKDLFKKYERSIRLIWCYIYDNQIDIALSTIFKVIYLENEIIINVISTFDEKSRIEFIEKNKVICSLFYSLVNDYYISNKEIVSKLYNYLLSRKGISLEKLANQRNNAIIDNNQELQILINDLYLINKEIKKISLIGFRNKDDDNTMKLSELIGKRENIDSIINQKLTKLENSSKTILGSYLLDSLKNLIPKKTKFIDFYQISKYDINTDNQNKKFNETHCYLAFEIDSLNPDNIGIKYICENETLNQQIKEYLLFNSEIYEFDQYVKDPDIFSKLIIDEINESLQLVHSYSQLGDSLFKILLEPFFDNIDDYNHIILSPDGFLHTFPFDILPINNYEYVIDEVLVSYVFSGRELINIQLNNLEKWNEPLVFANPDYDYIDSNDNKSDMEIDIFHLPPSSLSKRNLLNNRKNLFKSLPYFEPEGRIVSKLLNCPCIQKRDFNKHAITSINSPIILHLITHGFYYNNEETKEDIDDNDDPLKDFSSISDPFLRSGLALSGINTYLRQDKISGQFEDTTLTSDEVLSLDLSLTEIVSISACESGLGDVQNGEGIIGLRRSFILAGAKTLISSLWSVNDKATCELMKYFYQFLLQGKGRSESLREAKILIRFKYGHSFYWGAFICHGNYLSLPSNFLHR